MTVSRPAALPAQPGDASDCDVVIVGGGPAGLSAALWLATAGLSVVILDEQPELGGQYYRRPSPAALARVGDHRPAGGRLISAVRSAGVDCRTGTSVWGVADDGRTLFTAPAVGAGGVAALAGRYVVVATGAYERVIPFPGWELPGVTTAGFAQHMASGEGTAVGQRVLLAGSGPFLLPVACSLIGLGVTVVGVAEAGQPYRPSTLGAATAVRFPARLAELAGYAVRLARHRVPLWQGRVVARADADKTGRVGSVTLAATTDPAVPVATFGVDALCVGMGFRPQAELPRLLGCEVRADPASGDLLPVTGPDGRSSRPDVYVAGEAAGIGGVRQALAEGELAASAILAREGLLTRRGGSGWQRRRHQRFAALTARLYPHASALTTRLGRALPDAVNICRCEAVTAGQVRTAAAGAASAAATDAGGGTPMPADLAVVRGLTRAGMGPCQGRECSATVAALCDASPAAPGMTRMPVRPVPLAAVASLEALMSALPASTGTTAGSGIAADTAPTAPGTAQPRQVPS